MKEERPLNKTMFCYNERRYVSQARVTGPFQPCIDYGPDTIDESVEIPERESKKDETSKNISNLNKNAVLSDSTKDTRQIIQNQRNYAESDSDASTVEYTLTHASNNVTSKSDQHTGLLSPKNQNDMGNNDFSEVHMSPVKKKKKRDENNFRLCEASNEKRHCGNFFEPEESPSESEQSPIKKKRTLTPSGFSQKKSSKIRPSRNENNNEEGPLRINPSVTKRHANSSVKMSQKQAYQTLSNVQVECDSSRTSPVKRKSSKATYDAIHQNHFGPEASVIESKTLPKKITQVTGDQLNHSRQKNLSAKDKAPKNKRAAPVDNNEAHSDFGENSIPIVKGKENKTTVLGKNRHSLPPTKRTISRTHDNQSQNIVANGNISEPANGLRRSTRFRVPPLDIWRNERLVFETLPSGEVKCSIDKGSEEDKYGLIQIQKKAERRNKMKKKQAQRTVEKTPILDIKTGETVVALVHRPFESLEWSVPPNEVEVPPPYTMAKTFTAKSTSFGFLHISPFSTKEKQYSPVNNLHFVVVKGHLQVTIQDTTFTFTVGDSWVVPVGVPYSITNCSRARALLSFSAFKEE
ncbi:CENP-C_C domain-containing protein [Trichonephila inaurata madagascariensis]|uniref:CENP-C_C domain-containing protein n=1 Tax=Trichonephila inaurata madagascariensis TaxID=2747483 RepID=A0A8X6X0R9_9ARAC|nr:CENP-C_C domain-containing protein [Trichonephila inaurata madagascariensis]